MQYEEREESWPCRVSFANRSSASHTRKRQISERGGAGNEQIWERASGRRTVVGWMFTARRREASGWILHVLSEESGGVSSFSEVRQQVLASLFGQPTQDMKRFE